MYKGMRMKNDTISGRRRTVMKASSSLKQLSFIFWQSWTRLIFSRVNLLRGLALVLALTLASVGKIFKGTLKKISQLSLYVITQNEVNELLRVSE